MSVFYEAAKMYLAAGLHPIPCMPRDKRPLVHWKPYQDTAPTAAELEQWWQQWPDANVALVLGRGMFAVDIDSAEGRERLLAAGVELPADAPSVTTGKGAHVYLAGAAPDRVGLVPGVDIRGVGIVVAPPSIHPSGATYTWVQPMGHALPAAPQPLLNLIGKPQTRVSNAVDWFSQALLGSVEGGRNDTATKLAGRLLGAGLPADAVDLILQRTFAPFCDPPMSPTELSAVVTSIAKREGAPQGPPNSLAEAVKIAMAEILAPPQARKKPASTSIGSLDELSAGGLYPGEYVILGARPSVGKTAFVLQMARLLSKRGTGVLFVSLESTQTAVVRRLLSQESGVRAQSLKTGNLIELEKRMLAAAAESFSERPMWITHDVHTTEQLADTVSAYTPGTLGLVVVDYLQLMTTAEHLRDQRQRVEAVSKALRRLTVQHEIPLIALSSLSRPPKNVKEWEPSLADLRESGELEHDADIVWLMHRLLGEDDTKFKVAKNRDGEVSTSDLLLKFRSEVLTFEETK